MTYDDDGNPLFSHLICAQRTNIPRKRKFSPSLPENPASSETEGHGRQNGRIAFHKQMCLRPATDVIMGKIGCRGGRAGGQPEVSRKYVGLTRYAGVV